MNPLPHGPTPTPIPGQVPDRSVKFIDVSTPKFPNMFAVVDSEDYKRLTKDGKWSTSDGRRGVFYAVRQTKTGENLKMHREIAQPQPGELVDHINGDGLDNRKGKLRIATSSQNQANCREILPHNTSGFRGVSYHKHNKLWYVRIHVEGKTIHLGTRKNPEEASKLYDIAAIEYFGEFAKTNTMLRERKSETTIQLKLSYFISCRS